MASFQWHVPWRRHGHQRQHRERIHSEEELLDSGAAGGALTPVLLIPGIGGSILNAVSHTGSKERIWVRLFMADREFRTRLWSKYNPQSGKSESLDPNTHIEVPDDRYGLYSCDVLDPDIAVSLDAVDYFHSMIIEMHKWGYVDGKDLFGFGYDFRQSNRLPEVMEKLLGRLRDIHEQTGRKVDVVTHSMGGLLFRSFVALHYDDVAKYVNKWVAIAAPFRGAPGFILDTLLTGVEFVKGWGSSLFINKWSMHQLLVECPSVYELMADYSFEWEAAPELRIVRECRGKDGASSVAQDTFSDPSSIVSLMERALRDNTIDVNGETIPLPLNKDCVALARDTRKLWRGVRLPECVEFFSIYGVGLDTPFHSQYGSTEAPLNDLSEILHRDALFECVDGDGTVPKESSMGDGLAAMYRVGVTGDHRALLNDTRVHRILQFFLKVPPHDALYDPYTDCVLLPSRAEVESEMAKVESGSGEGSPSDVDQRPCACAGRTQGLPRAPSSGAWQFVPHFLLGSQKPALLPSPEAAPAWARSGCAPEPPGHAQGCSASGNTKQENEFVEVSRMPEQVTVSVDAE